MRRLCVPVWTPAAVAPLRAPVRARTQTPSLPPPAYYSCSQMYLHLRVERDMQYAPVDDHGCGVDCCSQRDVAQLAELLKVDAAGLAWGWGAMWADHTAASCPRTDTTLLALPPT